MSQDVCGLEQRLAAVSLDQDSFDEIISSYATRQAVVVREAVPDDACSLSQLHVSFKQEMASWESSATLAESSSEALRKLLMKEPGAVRVLTRTLEGSEELLGFIYSYPEKKSSKRSLYIAELYISPSVRGLGLAELLIACAFVHALTQQVTLAHLMVPRLFAICEPGQVCDRNLGANHLYRKCGFVKSDQPSEDTIHNLIFRVDCVVSALGIITQNIASRLESDRRPRRRASGMAVAALFPTLCAAPVNLPVKKNAPLAAPVPALVRRASVTGTSTTKKLQDATSPRITRSRSRNGNVFGREIQNLL